MSKFHFKGYRPNFFSGFDSPPEFGFDTFDELVEHDWVNGFMQHHDFQKFSLNDTCLMAEYGEPGKDSQKRFVVGFLTGSFNEIGLPKTCFEKKLPLNDFSAALAVARKHADINNLTRGDGCATMED